MDIPKEYIASAALESASSITDRRAAVRPKVNDPSVEHANLWGLIVAPPGELKSLSVNQALKPISNLEREERTRWEQISIAYQKELAVLSEREFFREAWSGDGEHSYDRVSCGCVYIPHACLSLFGAIQPGNFDSLIHSAGKDGRSADGPLQRLQILLHPDRGGASSGYRLVHRS